MEKEMEYSYKYPRPALTTDCVIFGYDRRGLSVLLVERGLEPYKGAWALPGGFMRMDESADECAARELKEETHLEVSHLEQVGAFSDVHRDPRGRVVTIAYFALVRTVEVAGGDDAADARWFPIHSLPQLAFDHKKILEAALQTLKEKIHFEPIGFNLLPEVFTMPDLQAIYENILGTRFDRRNFASKMQRTGILNRIDDRTEDTASRIPVHYSLNAENYLEFKDEFDKFEW